MPDTPKDAKGIFLAALEIHDPAELAAFVERSCGSDQDLRQRVEDLLRAYGDPGGPLEKLAAALASTKLTEPIREQPGTVIGSYKLMEQIGEGGFGLVYVAEQQHPIRRKVALKIIKPGMDTRDVIARFEAERQALALMDHPNIARVLDASTTESGRPYFVMELVRGIPITDYCDQSRLNTQERLALFVTVCHAVQHAHQKGIIHRDIKPSNVLVTSHDGQPVVKTIDFGVAKALHQKLTERTIYTRFAQMIGTPMYMSPEQAEMSGLDIDTRCDVYSLGVLMYELLTGTTPFDRKRLAQAAFDELRRILREEEPPKPSTQLSRSTDSLPTIAAQRRTDPAKLSRMFHGDLDWITMKALEKDRTRRYGSARELAEDIERWDRGDPVIAKPPTLGYLLGKYVRRNRLRLTTAVVIVAAALVGISLEVYRIDRDRREAIVNARRADEARAAADASKEEAQLREGEARQQRKRAEAALKEAETQRGKAEGQRRLAEDERRKAEENLHRARQVADRYFTLISESRLVDVPGSESLRQELLRAALEFYQQVPKAETDNAEIQAELAAAYFRMAQIENATSSGDWLVEAEKGLVILERLIAAKTSVAKFKSLDAGVTDIAGRGLNLDPAAGGNYNAQLRQRARDVFERASRAWEKLVALNPKSVGFRNDLATMYNVLSNLRLLDVQLSRSRATSLLQLAQLVRDGIKNQTKARDLLQALVNEYPERAHFRAALAVSEYRIGGGYLALKNYAAAIPPARRAESLSQSLTREFPNVPQYWSDLGAAYSFLAEAYFNQGKAAQTIDAVRNWMAAAERLKTAFPTVPQYRVNFEHVTNYGLFRLPDLLAKNNAGHRGMLAIVDLYAELKARQHASRAESREQAGQENDTGETDSSAKESAFPPPTTHLDAKLLAALKTLYERAAPAERAAILDAFTDRAHDPNCVGRQTYCMAEFAMRWWGEDRIAAVNSLERYARDMAGDPQFQLLLARARALAHQAPGGDQATADELLDRLFVALKNPSTDDNNFRRIATEIRRSDPTGKLASRRWARLLDHQDAVVRRRSIQSLSEDPGQFKVFKAQVEESLSDPDAGVRSAACDVLAKLGTGAKSALPLLRGLLKDAAPEVCAAAADALWKIDRDPSGAKPLVAAFDKHNTNDQADVDFRSKAIAIWTEMGKDAVDALPALREALAVEFETAKAQRKKNNWFLGGALMNSIVWALHSIDRNDTLAASGYPTIESPAPHWRLRVVDTKGRPVSGAMVHVDVESRIVSFFPMSMVPELRPDTKTDGAGYFELGYSIGKGDSKSRFLRELAMWATQLQLTLTIDHPKYPKQLSESLSVGMRIQNKPIVLADSSTIHARAHRAAESTNLAQLFPLFDGSVEFDSEWKESDGLLTIGRLDIRPEKGVQLARVLHVPQHGPVLFSDVVHLHDFKTASISLDLKLKPAVRLEGKLSDAVPRPVMNGRVIAKVQRMGGGAAAWEWGAAVPVDRDGRFAIDSLPPDEEVQLIAKCDGWISKSPSLDEQKRYAAENGGKDGSAQTPKLTFVDPRLCRLRAPSVTISVPMERTAKCLLSVVDEQGKPVPKASINLQQNYRWHYTYFGSPGWAEIKTLAQIQARMAAKDHKVAAVEDAATPLTTDDSGNVIINDVPVGGERGPASDDLFLTVSKGEDRFGALSRDAVAAASGDIKKITVRLVRQQ